MCERLRVENTAEKMKREKNASIERVNRLEVGGKQASKEEEHRRRIDTMVCGGSVVK
jgi:hypothetical protein